MISVLAAVLLGSRDWVAFALCGLTVAVLVLVIGYWRTSADSQTKWLAGLLKTAGFILLALCLVEPLWSTTRAKPGENLFLILADNSRSMDIRGDGPRSRGEWLQRLLVADEAPWQVRLAQDFDVRRYQFDARLRSVQGFDGLNFDGNSTAINFVLRTLADRYASRPLAGVLLLTDGNETGPRLTSEQLQKLPPVYPVLPPGGEAPEDLSVTRVSASETVFEDAPVTVQALVETLGMEGAEVTCQLVDEVGEVIDQATKTVSDGQPLTYRFQARPKRPGVTFYSVRVALSDEIEEVFTEESRSREATLENNTRGVALNREADPYRVLYVAGRPNWEYKFLRRGLEEDPQLDLVGFLRIARREAKFEFLGRADESSNPIFRGFRKTGDEETESYDQPVIIRLNTRDEAELRDGFPKAKAELFGYDAVILDDIEAAFFTHDQLSLIERFVSERGGGLMMLGGPDTFRHGGYDRTPVADALPVYLDLRQQQKEEGPYRLSLTREGWLEPWMRLRDNEADEKSRLSSMPGFLSVSRVETVKPVARVLATASPGGSTRYPAIVSQPYGRGRVLAVTIGDLWRWGLQREADAEDDLSKAWRQMVRWLVADTPRRLEGTVARRQLGSRQTMQLSVRVRDELYQPQDNANLTVLVRPPEGSPLEILAEPSLEEAGLFDATFVPREPGHYRASITQVDEAGTSQERTLGWASNPAAEEYSSVAVNEDAMRSLAEVTGGEVVAADDLAEFVATLPSRKVPLTETWLTPLWHRSWMFLLVLVCLVGEWGIRRVRGLP